MTEFESSSDSPFGDLLSTSEDFPTGEPEGDGSEVGGLLDDLNDVLDNSNTNSNTGTGTDTDTGGVELVDELDGTPEYIDEGH